MQASPARKEGPPGGVGAQRQPRLLRKMNQQERHARPAAERPQVQARTAEEVLAGAAESLAGRLSPATQSLGTALSKPVFHPVPQSTMDAEGSSVLVRPDSFLSACGNISGESLAETGDERDRCKKVKLLCFFDADWKNARVQYSKDEESE